MLCFLLAAYCSLATADTYLSPSNSSQCKEESSLSSTSTVDPWSPVVGDTEGVPDVTTRSESVHGRRAAISLVENIRRQLMRDNYDYISDESDEQSMTKTPSPSQDNSKRSTSARNTSRPTAMPPKDSKRQSPTSPPVETSTFAAVPLRRTSLLPPLSDKPVLSQIQVARVDMPSKSKIKHFSSYSDSPILRSLDEKSHGHATTVVKDIKSEIDVSKKDLFFYMDDIHLRRNNPSSAVSSFPGRRENKLPDMKHKINVNERKQNVLQPQKIKSRSRVIDKHSDVKHKGDYDINQNNRRRNQLNVKTQSYPDEKDKSVETDKVIKINDGNHHQKEIQFDNTAKQSPNTLYDKPDEKNHTKQDDKKNSSSIGEYSHRESGEIYKQERSQINVSLSQNSVHDMTQEPRSFGVNKEVQQNNQANREKQLHEKEHKEQISNREQYRRSIHRRSHRRTHRRKHNRNHKYTEQPNEIQHDDSAYKNKDTKYDIKQEIKPQIKRSSKNIYNKHNPSKHKSPESSQEKKVHKSINEQSVHSNKQSHKVKKKYKSVQSSNRKKRTRHQIEDIVTQKNNDPENQSEKDNSLYTQNDDKTTNKVTDKRLHKTKSYHQDHIQKEATKNVNANSKQSNFVNQNENHFSINIDGENTHDELKNDYNEDKNQQYQDQKSQYTDSMENEDYDTFDGRRMNRPSNDTQLAQKLDLQDGECNNSQHGCLNEEDNKQSVTTNEEQLTSPTAKYKILKVRAAGGSRRSYAGERRFLQERGPKGVALFALDGAPFPQFRLPRSRRQYMDDQADKRPPLIEQISRKSLNKKQSKHRSRKNED